MALLSVSVIQRELGHLPKALATAHKALKISQDHHLRHHEALSLIRLANVYVASKELSKAITLFHRSKNLIPVTDEFALAVIPLLMADAFEQMSNLDSAWYYGQLAYNTMSVSQTLPPNVFTTLGNVQAKQGNHRLALKYYHLGAKSALRSSNYRQASTIFTKVASLYKNRGQLDSAIYYAKQGLYFGEKLSYANRILAASSLLAELYESQDPIEALRFYKIASAAKDSLYSAEKVQAMKSLDFDVQERQREAEKAQIIYKARVRQFALAAGLAVIIAIAVLLYLNNLNKHKANALLTRQKEEINSQNEQLQETLLNLKATQSQLLQKEKLASLGELTAGIAHEIQNPLNFVNNFSEVSQELVCELRAELQAGHSQEAAGITDVLEQNLQKIYHHGRRADAIVKNMLQHSRISNSEKQLANLNTLTEEYLRLSYYGIRTKDKHFTCTLETSYDQNLEKVEVVPQELGRVLLNLFNNAFYAVQQKQKQRLVHVGVEEEAYTPTVNVSTRQLEDRLEIRVRDNGTGMPNSVESKIFQPFFTTKPTGQGTGLGLSLSYDIITKGHGGEMRVASEEGEWSEFTISIPYTPASKELPTASTAPLPLANTRPQPLSLCE